MHHEDEKRQMKISKWFYSQTESFPHYKARFSLQANAEKCWLSTIFIKNECGVLMKKWDLNGISSEIIATIEIDMITQVTQQNTLDHKFNFQANEPAVSSRCYLNEGMKTI